jgi:hypothetical protein
MATAATSAGLDSARASDGLAVAATVTSVSPGWQSVLSRASGAVETAAITLECFRAYMGMITTENSLEAAFVVTGLIPEAPG